MLLLSPHPMLRPAIWPHGSRPIYCYGDHKMEAGTCHAMLLVFCFPLSLLFLGLLTAGCFASTPTQTLTCLSRTPTSPMMRTTSSGWW